MPRFITTVVFCGLALASRATDISTFQCPLKACVLNSTLASAGPAFKDLVNLKALTAKQKSGQEQCPFGGDDNDPPPTKKEYMKYMRGLSKVGEMSPDQRREWAAREAAKLEANLKYEEEEVKEPSVNVSMPGVEALNRTTLAEIRKENKLDLLVTFYAPWCPHCKAFVTSENAPIKALSASLEKVNGPRVVTFDVTASDAPEALMIHAVPTIYLIKTTGEAIQFKQNPHDLNLLMAFALGDSAPAAKSAALLTKPITRHLRTSESAM
mmetsp:Transcript_58054/g.92244  ORF Transcript_58054/g.92244 Transcript_58054/m.92244 type:complete len:268 (-) Transcript_58054:33-836(-)